MQGTAIAKRKAIFASAPFIQLVIGSARLMGKLNRVRHVSTVVTGHSLKLASQSQSSTFGVTLQRIRVSGQSNWTALLAGVLFLVLGEVLLFDYLIERRRTRRSKRRRTVPKDTQAPKSPWF